MLQKSIGNLQHEETEASQQDCGTYRLDFRGVEGPMLSKKTLTRSGGCRLPPAMGLPYCTRTLHGRE